MLKYCETFRISPSRHAIDPNYVVGASLFKISIQKYKCIGLFMYIIGASESRLKVKIVQHQAKHYSALIFILTDLWGFGFTYMVLDDKISKTL